jgi:hypothetical protein
MKDYGGDEMKDYTESHAINAVIHSQQREAQRVISESFIAELGYIGNGSTFEIPLLEGLCPTHQIYAYLVEKYHLDEAGYPLKKGEFIRLVREAQRLPDDPYDI